MNCTGIARVTLIGIILAVGYCMADTTSTYQMHMKQSGFLGLELGQIVHGLNDSKTNINGENIANAWLERMLFQYVNDISVTEHIRLKMAIECQMSYSYPYGINTSWYTKTPQFSFYPDRVEGTYSFEPATDKPYLELGFGYFPFKTNPNVKNLGEYMFRTGTYPVYVLNSFNRPYARLLGLRASSTVFGSLHQDILLTSSTQAPPLGNLNLSYLASYNIAKILEIGAGISFCSIMAFDTNLTTPRASQYITENGDTAFYTFKGTKLMGRFAFDPKELLPNEILGISKSVFFDTNDLRLYGEVCITGLKNYKNYDTSITSVNNFYENRSDRTLIMLGLNIPTYKVLDVLSIEVEHMSNKYPNSTLYVLGQNSAFLPLPSPTSSLGSTQKVYPWYWSIYAKKTFLERFSVVAQFAHDHMRPINNDPANQYSEDVLERKGDWWWNVRLNLNY